MSSFLWHYRSMFNLHHWDFLLVLLSEAFIVGGIDWEWKCYTVLRVPHAELLMQTY